MKPGACFCRSRTILYRRAKGLAFRLNQRIVKRVRGQREFVCAMRNIPLLIRPQGRAGNDTSCANCGRRLHPKRGSRRMRFCGSACRQAAFRAKKWASRYEGREPLRSIQDNAIASMACNGHFRHRASGICGPNRVVSRELFAGVTWCVVVSSDGIRAEVARLGNGAAP